MPVMAEKRVLMAQFLTSGRESCASRLSSPSMAVHMPTLFGENVTHIGYTDIQVSQKIPVVVQIAHLAVGSWQLSETVHSMPMAVRLRFTFSV